MRENHDFVVPVSLRLRVPCFLGPHDTLPCVLIPTTTIKDGQCLCSNLLLHDVETLCDTCCKTLLIVDAATVEHVGSATHELLRIEED